jgi:hypothetical protein
VLRSTGEFVHPGEHEPLEKYREEEQEPIEAGKRRALELRKFPEGTSAVGGAWYCMPSRERKIGVREVYVKLFEKEEATCEICRNRTRDWWTVDRAENRCNCNDCFHKGKY